MNQPRGWAIVPAMTMAMSSVQQLALRWRRGMGSNCPVSPPEDPSDRRRRDEVHAFHNVRLPCRDTVFAPASRA